MTKINVNVQFGDSSETVNMEFLVPPVKGDYLVYKQMKYDIDKVTHICGAVPMLFIKVTPAYNGERLHPASWCM